MASSPRRWSREPRSRRSSRTTRITPRGRVRWCCSGIGAGAPFTWCGVFGGTGVAGRAGHGLPARSDTMDGRLPQEESMSKRRHTKLVREGIVCRGGGRRADRCRGWLGSLPLAFRRRAPRPGASSPPAGRCPGGLAARPRVQPHAALGLMAGGDQTTHEVGLRGPAGRPGTQRRLPLRGNGVSARAQGAEGASAPARRKR